MFQELDAGSMATLYFGDRYSVSITTTGDQTFRVSVDRIPGQPFICYQGQVPHVPELPGY